jgi:hypothetical protein
MALETKLAECGVEEAMPLAIVGLVNVQHDGDVRADRDCIEGDSGDWVDREIIGRGSSRV